MNKPEMVEGVHICCRGIGSFEPRDIVLAINKVVFSGGCESVKF